MNGGRGYGVLIIDLRNGNQWCVAEKPKPPQFAGTFNLDAIPAGAPSR